MIFIRLNKRKYPKFGYIYNSIEEIAYISIYQLIEGSNVNFNRMLVETSSPRTKGGSL